MRIDGCAAVMHATSGAHSLQGVMPVRHCTGAEALRLKFQALLEAIQMPVISASLATADFSLLYRTFVDPSELEVELALTDHTLELSLQGQLQTGDCLQTLHSHLVYFSSLDPSAFDHANPWIRVSRSLPISEDIDLQLVRDRLVWQSPFEIEVAAQATKLQLVTTQERLTTVEGDIKIASDIQQHLLLSKAELKALHPSLDCHAYLVASKDVGGDFYDVIHLGDDLIAVVVGDVSGKGVPAAIMMATCSTLIRAYFETDRSPRVVVQKVNQRLCQGNELDCMFTTLFLAVIDCRHNVLAYSNAGHLPALVISDGAPIVALDLIHGPALGVFADHLFGEDTADFGPGDRLLLYTDGATESFNTNSELYGYERLHAYCAARPNAEQSRPFLSGLLLDINLFSAPELAHDDITLLSVRRLPSPPSPPDQKRRITLSVQSSAHDLESLKRQVESTANDLGLTESTLATLLLVLDELVSNLLSHAPVSSDAETAILILDLRTDQSLLYVSLKDNSPPFDPFSAPEPNVEDDVALRAMGGLGLFLVRSLAHRLSYSYEPPWNCVDIELPLVDQDV